MEIKITKFRIFSGIAIAIMAVAGIWSFVLATTISDSFSDETKIGKGTIGVNIDTSGGQVSLAPCYSPDPGWSKIADTTVRDISGAYNATVDKDIYCDASNCVLWANGVEISNTVCIATDSNVYGNILWSASDVSGTKTWGPTTTAISGGDVGGALGSPLTVGNNNVDVAGKNNLERYYISATGTYLAQDACKLKGSGWRLPTILELDSIRDQAKGSPYSYLPAIIADIYWSSTENSTSGAYSLYFNGGNVNSRAKSSAAYVRCVRGY